MPSGATLPAFWPLTPSPLALKQAALLPWLSEIGWPKLLVGKLKNGTSDVGIGPVVGLPGAKQVDGMTDAFGKELTPPITLGAAEVKSNCCGLVKMSSLLCGLVMENC